jgi:hypothetical protein
MTDFDPLSPSSSPNPTITNINNEPSEQRHHYSNNNNNDNVPSISPLAPRSPLPGQRQFRAPPPPPFDTAWAVDHSTSDSNDPTSNWSPQRPTPPLVARSASTHDEPRPRISVDDERKPKMTEGVKQVPMDGFVRMRVLGLEKNRRDIYIKFSAEVSCHHLAL